MKGPILLVVSATLAGGCYLKPASSNTPLRSPEGVHVTLVGQDCADHSGMDGDPISRQLGIQVSIDNPTDRVLRIHEEAIRLQVGSDSSEVLWPKSAEVKPHSSATLRWSFNHHAMCHPSRDFVVDWNGALVLEDHPLSLASLSFRP
jgi:hypothetical protein